MTRWTSCRPAARLWEGGDAVGDSYGTTLSLELLPYFTDGTHRLDGGHLLRVVGHERRSTS